MASFDFQNNYRTFFLPSKRVNILDNNLVSSSFASKYAISSKNVTFSFHAVVWLSKQESYFSSYFQISEYIRRYLPSCFLACKYLFPAVFWPFSCNCISDTYPFAFWPRKTSFVPFWLVRPFLLNIFTILNAKYKRSLPVCLLSRKKQLLPFRKQFNT